MERRDFLRLPLALTGVVLATGAMGIQPASAATTKTLKGLGYGGTDAAALKRLKSSTLIGIMVGERNIPPFPRILSQ